MPTDAYMAGYLDGLEGLPSLDDDPDYAQGWADGGGDAGRGQRSRSERWEWDESGHARDPRCHDDDDARGGWPEPPPRRPDGRYRVLMVCTGNTSRSALAEAAAKASRPPWLLVASAGTYAFGGSPASAKASAAAAGMGLDLSGHRSSELAPGPLAAADEVWCMTRRHMGEVLAAAPWAGPKLRLLDPAGDIADPHGGDIAKYRETARRVAGAVRRRVSGLARPGAEAAGGPEGEGAARRAAPNARKTEREAAAIRSAPALEIPQRSARRRAAAARPLDHGPTFRSWQAKARRAIRRAFSGVGEDDESDWHARVKSALAETLPHAMYRGFSVRAADEGEARRLAEAEVAGARRAAPHSFSKAVARSFAVGVEPWWAAAGSVSGEGRGHRGKAGQWGAVVSVDVTPGMVDWSCIDSGNAMFGDPVYDHLPFDEPVGDAIARMLADAGGTHNAEWDLEVRPYPPGSASIEVFRIGPGSAGETEGFWRSELGGAGKSAARDTLEWWNTCGRCGSDLSVAGRAGDDEDRPLCRSCWERLSRPVPAPAPPRRRWWRWRPAAALAAR